VASPLTAEIPIFLVCRDKVAALSDLVAWLEDSGYQRLILVDNASTYPPLLEYFDRTPHEVVRLSENLGPHRSIWETGVVDRYASGQHYVVSDSDVVPDEACPSDALDFFLWVLRRYPKHVKVGFGLKIDDLPSRYALAEDVRGWESRWWHHPLSKLLYDAPIDTTFALYRPDSTFESYPAIRTGAPYIARHYPWYSDTAQRTEEEQYYREHCDPVICHWDLEGHEPSTASPMSLPERIRWRMHVALKVERDRSAPRRYRPPQG
jgi:hypothetical protein